MVEGKGRNSASDEALPSSSSLPLDYNLCFLIDVALQDYAENGMQIIEPHRQKSEHNSELEKAADNENAFDEIAEDLEEDDTSNDCKEQEKLDHLHDCMDEEKLDHLDQGGHGASILEDDDSYDDENDQSYSAALKTEGTVKGKAVGRAKTRSFYCHKCGKEFRSGQALGGHQRAHSGRAASSASVEDADGTLPGFNAILRDLDDFDYID